MASKQGLVADGTGWFEEEVKESGLCLIRILHQKLGMTFWGVLVLLVLELWQ